MKLSALVNYYKEVKSETKRVTWCDRKYILSSTAMICVVVFITSLCCLFIDYGASKLISALLKIKLF